MRVVQVRIARSAFADSLGKLTVACRWLLLD